MQSCAIPPRYFPALSLWLALALLFGSALSAQEASFPLSYSSPVVVPGIPPLGRFGVQFVGSGQSAVVDLNGDGLKDVVLPLVVGLSTEASPAITPRLLINDGHGGMIDQTEALIVPPLPHMFLVRDILVADFNGDGQPDLFFGTSGKETRDSFGEFPCEQNRILLSRADGRYQDTTAESLPHVVDDAHGSAAADIDGDGHMDIWVNTIGCSSHVPGYLLHNDGHGHFTIIADLTDGSVPGFVGRNGRLPRSFMGAVWTHFGPAGGNVR